MRRSLVAAVGVLAALLGSLVCPGAATPAADQPQLTVRTPHVFYVFRYGRYDPGLDEQMLPFSVSGDAMDVVVTLDLAGLGPAATMADTNGICKPAGSGLRCPVGRVTGPVGEDGLSVTAAPGSRVGQTGFIRYRISASDAGTVSGRITVMVGRPELHAPVLKTVRDVRPGETFHEPVMFRNDGDVPTSGLGVLLSSGHDLDLLARHRNCRYQRSGGRIVAGYCAFPEVAVRPGRAVAFGSPVDLRPASTLMYGQFAYDGWSLAGPVPVEPLDLRDFPLRGSGPAVRLVPAPVGARFTDGGAFVRVTADNHADFAAYGATVRGRVGQTVQIEVGVRNRGPGSMDLSGREQSDSYALTFTPPAGTTVVGNPFPGEEDPWTCAPRRKAAAAYHCRPYGETLNAGDRETFVFNLRIDDLVPGATGKVEVEPATSPWPVRDQDATDDVASVRTQVTADTPSGGESWPWVVGISAAAGLALLALLALVWRRRVAASSG